MMRLPTPLTLRPAETDHVWVVVPFSRPENFEHVLANFRRQKFPFKKLVLVFNGRALGTELAQQQMMSIMPWMMMFVMSPFASGLLIYWITSNCLTMAQQFYLYSRHPGLKAQSVKDEAKGSGAQGKV